MSFLCVRFVTKIEQIDIEGQAFSIIDYAWVEPYKLEICGKWNNVLWSKKIEQDSYR